MRKWISLVTLTLFGVWGCEAPAPADQAYKLHYVMTPIIDGSNGNSLKVDLLFQGDADGETEINLGNNWADEDHPWKRFKQISVTGNESAKPPTQTENIYTIYHGPSKLITMSYTLSHEDQRDPVKDLEYFYAPVLQNDLFHLIGATSLAAPRPEQKIKVSIEWADAPANWHMIDTIPDTEIDSEALGRLIIAAGDIQTHSRDINGAKLSMLITGKFDFDPPQMAETTVNIRGALNELMEDPSRDYHISLLGAPDGSGHSGFVGTGLYNGFAAAGSSDMNMEFLAPFLAHEITHDWIPDKLGDWPRCKSGECPASIKWFTEGFTDYISVKAMQKSGYWEQVDAVEFANQVLRQYYLSPARSATSKEIDAKFWTDLEYEKQPYWRGFIMAMNWDREMKSFGENDTNIMTVIGELKRTAAASDTRPVLSTDYLTNAFSAVLGRDAKTDVEDYYHNGDMIAPTSWFKGCAELHLKPVQNYDVGFDPETTLGSGIVSGVVTGSNAEKAGLRDGQTFLNKVSGGGGDVNAPLVLEVQSDGQVKTLSYIPVSGPPTDVPQFEPIGACKT